jgi:YD repeat-containing protein
VAADPHGGFYIADTYNRRVRKVSPEGVISTVAGGGSKTSDGIPATDASIYLVWDVSVDIHGNLYIAEGNRIRKVTPDGVIHTVVGSGRGGYCGDDGPAAGACLADPQGIFVDREGFIYIADTFNHRVRMVTPDGMIYTVAGTGQEGFFGDGGPATGARLDHPSGVCVDRWGNIYIADRDNHRIRKVSPDGVITTYAGTGSPGIESEGGPAREAQLDSPVDVAVDSQGDLYIANRGDYQEKRHFYVRVVRSDGTMETLAGTSDGWGYNGDGLPAKEAFLYWPSGLDVGPGGRLYVADTYNNRIRRVTLGGSSLRSQQGLVFAEEGLLHLFEGSGRHLQSQDLYSGSVLLEFHYDDEGLLSSITDPNGNETLIMRDARGYPQTIVSPDGLETQLVVDDGGRLLRVIQPDGAVHSFQYNEGGLLTSVKKPNGSLYEFQYDRWGHLTDAMDEEGGHWSYSFSPVLETGGGLFEVKSSEGQLLSYLDSWGTDGSYESVITSPWGDETDFLLKSNRLEGQKYLPCGKRIEFTFGFDPVLSFRYPKELKEGTSSGLVRRWRLKRHYQDQDGDSELDLVVKELTLNSRPYILGRNLLSSRWSITAPESRVISGSYDPTNLKVTSIEVPGLHPIELGYDSRGRLISLRMAQRSATFSYDHQGYLSALTDSLGFTTSMENDPMGRPIKVRRPDGSLIIFSYDGNGNLTVIETPSGAIHAFTYSRVDLPVSYRPPISPAYVYLFDRDRRLEGILLPSGRGISLNYTSGRLTSIETPEGEIRLGYLCGSRPSFLSRGTEGIRWEYDGPLVVSEETFGTLRGSIS